MHVSHGQTAKGSFCPGLSAGSYSGICLLHLLWKLPYIEVRGKLGGIACPPELLSLIPAPEGQRLHASIIPPTSCAAGNPAVAPSRASRACVRF